MSQTRLTTRRVPGSFLYIDARLALLTTRLRATIVLHRRAYANASFRLFCPCAPGMAGR